MTLGRAGVRLRWPGGHWPALVIGVAAALATGSAFWLAFQTVGDAEERIERERLGLVELAAAHADHTLLEAYFEATNFSVPLLLLDARGEMTAVGGSGPLRSTLAPQAAEVAANLAGTTDRSISRSFLLPESAHTVVALSIPIFDDRGIHTGTVVGFLDVDEHIRGDLAAVTAQFGATAHTDVIDARGIVIASSDHDSHGNSRHHADFYRHAASQRIPTVEGVPHADGSPPHVVAYAPMGGAPWGVALGASEADTFLVPDARRRELVSAAIASAVTFALGMLIVTVEVRGKSGGLTPRQPDRRPESSQRPPAGPHVPGLRRIAQRSSVRARLRARRRRPWPDR